MALFSTREATANFTNVVPKKLEPFQAGREFFSYSYYAIALGPDAIPFNQWEGQDVYWLVRDRQMSNHRWQVAMNLITANQYSDYLEPFAQINSYYKIMHIWVIGKKHQIKWLYGAYSLVNALTENYSALSLLLQRSVIGLLIALNKGISNYAITQFHTLLFGIYANSPRINGDAWAFDRDFIIGEQNNIAFPVYSNSLYAGALEVMNELFNDVGWRSMFKDIGSYFETKTVPIPVFPQLYHSDITNSNPTRYGQDARIEVPLVMLYPNHFFYNDNVREFSTDPDPTKPGHFLTFNETSIAAIMKEMESVPPFGQIVGQILGNMLIAGNKDNPAVIYNAYLNANRKVMNIFK